MDLRSIINSDSNTNPPSQRARPGLESSVKHIYFNHQQIHANSYEAPSQGHQDARANTRPPQPPPLQPPAYRDIPSPNGSFSHRSAQSPYQATPNSSIVGNQYPFPQPHHHASPATSSHGPSFPQQEQITGVITAAGRNYGQPSPSILTPTSTTPAGGYAYPQYHRPPSSHSATTPTSAQSYVQTFSRDSPRAIHTHINASPHQHSAHHYHSQPGTPLGPPPPIGRPSPVSHRASSGPSPYESYRSQSGSSHGHHQIPPPSLATEASNVLASPVNYNSRPPLPSSRSYMTDEERERSQSVSPKTIPSQTKSEQMEVTPEAERHWSGGVTPAKRKVIDEIAEPRSFFGDANRSFCEQRIIHEPSNGRTMQTHLTQNTPLRDVQAGHEQQGAIMSNTSTMDNPGLVQSNKELDRVDALNSLSSDSAAVTLSRQQPTTPQVPSNQRTPTSQTSPTPPSAGHAASLYAAPTSTNSNMPRPIETTVSPLPASSPGQPPMRKRQRFETPPIFAQSRRAGRNGSGNPLLPNRRPVPAKPIPHIKQEQHIKQEGNGSKDHGPYQSPTPFIKEETNGHTAAAAEITKPKTRPRDANEEVLGPWEKSITDMEPADEIMRTIADFLFTEIVLRNDVGAGPVGGGSAPGAVLEIEAKIGQIIDKNTNERLRLPVMTECVVSKNDPNLRIAFKSSMTEVSTVLSSTKHRLIITRHSIDR